MPLRTFALLFVLAIHPAQSPDRPPVETGPFKKADLVEVVRVDPTVHLDVRYATSHNLRGKPVYRQARAFLQREAALALERAGERLRRQGFGIVVFDGYRPWSVTKAFWDATPPDKRNFVADPSKGSRHNRGCAVDLTLYELASGRPVEMPSVYDEMSERAYPRYKGGTAGQRRLRDRLRAAMEAEDFTVYEFEWWHFDYKDWAKYPVMNVKFQDIKSK